MINNYLERQIKENFPYQPTLEQEIAVKSLSEFLLSTLADEVFILRGYAGTGKTSLVGALVKTMDQLQQKSVLLAPTYSLSAFLFYFGGKNNTYVRKAQII